MPGRGRPPKPIAIHRLEGNYDVSRDARRTREPRVDGDFADCPAPDWVTDNQRRLWGELVGDSPEGLLRWTDPQLLANYVGLADRFEWTAITQNALDVASSAPMLMRSSRRSSSRATSA